MAKTVSKTATVETAYGQPLPTAVKFNYSYVELQKGDEIPAAELPKDNDELIRTYVNAKRNSAARAKAQTDALEAEGIVAPKSDDPKVVRRNFMRNLVLAGKSEDEATQIADTVLGSDFGK
jgi:hypothetical protein